MGSCRPPMCWSVVRQCLSFRPPLHTYLRTYVPISICEGENRPTGLVVAVSLPISFCEGVVGGARRRRMTPLAVSSSRVVGLVARHVLIVLVARQLV